MLSYYQDSTNLYFPHGHIDLSFGISASITDRDKEGVHFSVVTSHRTYNFRAESAPSAKEWVKSLQRVIFRSHNDGDSVKISLPIDNIIDVEDTQMMEFSDTCKIRVIDSDETFAIDEVRSNQPSFCFGAFLTRKIYSTFSPSSPLAKRPSTSSKCWWKTHLPRVQQPAKSLLRTRGSLQISRRHRPHSEIWLV